MFVLLILQAHGAHAYRNLVLSAALSPPLPLSLSLSFLRFEATIVPLFQPSFEPGHDPARPRFRFNPDDLLPLIPANPVTSETRIPRELPGSFVFPPVRTIKSHKPEVTALEKVG